VSDRVEPSLPYVVVDVFTDRPFAGNPLAVVLDADRLSDRQLQLIAREFNLSETAFPIAPGDPAADYRLRIFTPTVEVPFAGHPSVGSAWWLARSGRIGTGLVHQECGAGLLPVTVTDEGATLTGGAASVSEPVDATAALSAVGLSRAHLVDDEVRIASTGLAFAVVFVTPDAVARCVPDMAVLRTDFAHPRPATGVYVVDWDAEARHAKVRMFAGDLGSAEDPATGSAALALGARLVARGDLSEGKQTFTVEQGVDMGRPARLTVTCDVVRGAVERIQVTGGAVLVAEGRIAVPPA
jgi:trans-2,3-dihydro-3-hydroxyanthranilate isomerase